MNVFIIGASGLVGSNCLQHFDKQGWNVKGSYFSYPTDHCVFFNTLDLNHPDNFDLLSWKPERGVVYDSRGARAPGIDIKTEKRDGVPIPVDEFTRLATRRLLSWGEDQQQAPILRALAEIRRQLHLEPRSLHEGRSKPQHDAEQDLVQDVHAPMVRRSPCRRREGLSGFVRRLWQTRCDSLESRTYHVQCRHFRSHRRRWRSRRDRGRAGCRPDGPAHAAADTEHRDAGPNDVAKVVKVIAAKDATLPLAQSKCKYVTK